MEQESVIQFEVCVFRREGRYLSRRLPLLHERAPVPASGITRRAFPDFRPLTNLRETFSMEINENEFLHPGRDTEQRPVPSPRCHAVQYVLTEY